MSVPGYLPGAVLVWPRYGVVKVLAVETRQVLSPPAPPEPCYRVRPVALAAQWSEKNFLGPWPPPPAETDPPPMLLLGRSVERGETRAIMTREEAGRLLEILLQPLPPAQDMTDEAFIAMAEAVGRADNAECVAVLRDLAALSKVRALRAFDEEKFFRVLVARSVMEIAMALGEDPAALRDRVLASFRA